LLKLDKTATYMRASVYRVAETGTEVCIKPFSWSESVLECLDNSGGTSSLKYFVVQQ